MGKTVDLIIAVLAIFGMGFAEVLILMALWELCRFLRIAADVLDGKKPFNIQTNTNVSYKTEKSGERGAGEITQC